MRPICRALIVSVILGGSLCLAAPGLKEKPVDGPITKAQVEQSTKNLRELGLAMHNYHDVNGAFPDNLRDKDGKAILSWRVHLLPYLEQDQLYKAFKLNEPWDSESNKKLIDKIPETYQAVRGKANKGETFYQMFNWERGLIRTKPGKVNFATITDGLSNTFMIVEAGTPAIWTKPDDIAYDGKMIPKLGGMFDGDMHVVMGDGSVRKAKKGFDANMMRLFIEPNDGQVVDVDKLEPLDLPKGDDDSTNPKQQRFQQKEVEKK